MDDERDTPIPSIKMEDAPPIDPKASEGKPTYKSWKKKYRKMRIKFDQKMHEGEELHQREVKAHATSKRLAIEVDRLLDFLLDVNDAPQIPTEKRFDLSLPVNPSDPFFLEIDKPSEPPSSPAPGKSLRQLIAEVPHLDYAATVAQYPHVVDDMRGCVDSPVGDPSRAEFPPTFLTMDDVDNYLFEIDTHLRDQALREGRTPRRMLTTMAPLAKERANDAPVASLGSSAAARDAAGQLAANRDFALRNPTSVYNWLRKHAPKTFLQDHEGAGGDTDDHQGGGGGTGIRGGRKSTGEGRGGKGSRSSKRASAATSRDKRKSMDDPMEDPEDEVPGGTSGKGKRKRNLDDDTGYRPKGGSSRPTKKKRKSEGGGDAVPAKRSRKSDHGAGSAAPTDQEGPDHED